MKAYYDKSAQIAEIMMFVTSSSHPFILVEGYKDILFYKENLPETSSGMIRQLDGWENVVDMIRLSNMKGLKRVVGIIDGDYHIISGDGVASIPNILVTEYADIEMMLINSSAFEKLMKVYGSDDKLCGLDPRIIIKKSAKDLGLLRFISQMENLNLCFTDVKYSDFVNRSDLSVDLRKMVNAIYDRSVSKGCRLNIGEKDMLAHYNKSAGYYSLDQLCKGHDTLSILAIGLTRLFGSKKGSQLSEDVLFECLFLAYKREEFEMSKLYSAFREWNKRQA